MKNVRIGVLGLQGNHAMHALMLEQIEGVEVSIIKKASELNGCDGLILPGGESTTVGKLMERYDIDKAIIRRAGEGMSVMGTCTGMILLATDIENSSQQRLGLIDVTVRRNAFGRQTDSFETDLDIPGIGDNIRAVFIRAPFVTRAGDGVEVLSRLECGEIVMVRQDRRLAVAFHPEITDDTRVHEYFVNLTKNK